MNFPHDEMWMAKVGIWATEDIKSLTGDYESERGKNWDFAWHNFMFEKHFVVIAFVS